MDPLRARLSSVASKLGGASSSTHRRIDPRGLVRAPEYEKMKMMKTSEMRIARNRKFGSPDVVFIEQAPIPVPKRGQILVRTYAATVSTADWRLRSKNVPKGFGFIMGLLFGFKHPKYEALGTDLAGEVVALGEGVTQFRIGDRVVSNLSMKLGGHAEYRLLNEKSATAKIPTNVSYEQAVALVFGGVTALIFLRDKLKLVQNERLLVIGAGGAVGSSAIQLGKWMGAHVTAVCSTEKVSAVTELGVSEVIDYKKRSWLSEVEKYDVILDTVGGDSFKQIQTKLLAKGRLGLVVADLPTTLRSIWISLTQSQKVRAGPTSETASDLQFLLSLCEQGKFRPLIGATLPFEEIVEAHRRVESGHKLGSLVLKVST